MNKRGLFFLALILVGALFAGSASADIILQHTHEVKVTCVDNPGNDYNKIYFAGYSVRDCDDHVWTDVKTDNSVKGLFVYNKKGQTKTITLPDTSTGLNYDQSFKGFKLHFIVYRYGCLCDGRYDRISIDVSDWIKSDALLQNTFKFKVSPERAFANYDKVLIKDENDNPLVTLPKGGACGWHGEFTSV